jgi:hypothetical protein
MKVTTVVLEKMIRMILQVTENTLGVIYLLYSANIYLFLPYVLSSKEVLQLKAINERREKGEKNAS